MHFPERNPGAASAYKGCKAKTFKILGDVIIVSSTCLEQCFTDTFALSVTMALHHHHCCVVFYRVISLANSTTIIQLIASKDVIYVAYISRN